MTKEQFNRLKIGDKVRHSFVGVGIVVEKEENGYVVNDKGFDCGDGKCEVSYEWNERRII